MSPDPHPTTLRDRLRHDTRDAHARLDARLAALDLTRADGLADFLRMQLVGLDGLCADGPHLSGALIVDLRRALADDLSRLGAPVPDANRPPEPRDGTALDYIVLGSRLGTNVLRKRWLRATDPRVRRADAYFGVPPALPLWAAFCDATGARPAHGDAADRTVADARAIFARYADAARAVCPAG